MPTRFVHSPDLPGLDYACAAVVDRLVVTAGACPLAPDGTTVAPGDVVGQARRVLENLRTALVAAGVDLDDVVRLTVHVASAERADLVAAWDVVRGAFTEMPPATLLGVTVLGYEHQLVEVEAVAVHRRPTEVPDGSAGGR